MPRQHRTKEIRRAAIAKRSDGLAREVRTPTAPRESAAGPTSPAIKVPNRRDQDLIAEFLKNREGET
jgi:hypothetical protein